MGVLSMKSLFTEGGILQQGGQLVSALQNAPIRRAELEEKRASSKDAREFRDREAESQKLDVLANQLLQQRGRESKGLESRRRAAAKAATGGFKPVKGKRLDDTLKAKMAASMQAMAEEGLSPEDRVARIDALTRDFLAAPNALTESDIRAQVRSVQVAFPRRQAILKGLKTAQPGSQEEAMLLAELALVEQALPGLDKVAIDTEQSQFGGFQDAESFDRFQQVRRKQAEIRGLDPFEAPDVGAAGALPAAGGSDLLGSLQPTPLEDPNNPFGLADQDRLAMAEEKKNLANQPVNTGDIVAALNEVVEGSALDADREAQQANARVQNVNPDLFAARTKNAQIANALPEQVARIQKIQTEQADQDFWVKKTQDRLDAAHPGSANAKMFESELLRVLAAQESLASAFKTNIGALENMTTSIQNAVPKGSQIFPINASDVWLERGGDQPELGERPETSKLLDALDFLDTVR